MKIRKYIRYLSNSHYTRSSVNTHWHLYSCGINTNTLVLRLISHGYKCQCILTEYGLFYLCTNLLVHKCNKNE